MLRTITAAATAALLTTTGIATAQPYPELPDKSPRARVQQRVGLTDVWVDYSSPGVKDRTIWGELVPFGELWRTGANLNTMLHFSRDALFGGVAVEAGTYGVFTIPTKDEWTVILSRNTEAWGTGGYDAALDAARVTVEPASAPQRERLTFLFSNTTDAATRLDLEWAGLRVSVPIQVDTDAHVEAQIAEATGRAWVPYERSARYLLDQERDLDRALEYANAAVAIEASWRTLWVKARILAALGERRQAIRVAKKARELGDDSGAFRFYAPQMDAAISRWGGKS